MKLYLCLRRYIYPSLFLCLLVLMQMPLLLVLYKDQNQETYELLRANYANILEDVVYFPIPMNENENHNTCSFDNSWMQKRTYGGDRGHEGCDIFTQESISGYYPVISMTDGVVEQVGWLPQGGYRIGIRSEHGGYFYYAHLSEYSKTFHVGDAIYAGEQLGFVGDTGYGEEGTTGMFAPHLHVGIYFMDDHNQEFSVNPYWVLKKLKENLLKYSY